ncbi:MAG TPA: mannosyl-3-phosphoglycerate phosphatase [Dehalococcoidia bacterium]|nr:mannosyl-3-phosphoglycerate phosphatase [Dehalococcoidia bacterium]
MKKVIFTDLDGTLLDRFSYSYNQALEAISLLHNKEIPIVFCSAKTRAEQEVYREELNIEDPFIVENGGAIFIPRDYFLFPFNHHKATKDYLVIELGIPHRKVRKVLKRIKNEVGCHITGFRDMSVEEVARDTGLDLKFAALAKQREYDETFKIEDTQEKIELALAKIEEAGLSYIRGGRYYAAISGNDKGKATEILIGLFRRKLNKMETIGIGDSQNDLSMLKAVDVPVLVQKLDNHWEEINLASIYKVEGVGPQGWSKAIKELIGG